MVEKYENKRVVPGNVFVEISRKVRIKFGEFVMRGSFSLEIAQEPTYRWIAGPLLSLASSLNAQRTRHRPLHSDVRACLAARVNSRAMGTNNCCVVNPYQGMEQQP